MKHGPDPFRIEPLKTCFWELKTARSFEEARNTKSECNDFVFLHADSKAKVSQRKIDIPQISGGESSREFLFNDGIQLK